MKRKPDDDKWVPIAGFQLKPGPEWTACHLGDREYGPEICRVKSSLVQDVEGLEGFLYFSEWLVQRTIRAEKKAMAKVPKPPRKSVR